MSNILIIGNILKDVYLRLDERLNNFEVDEGGTPWLDLGFDGSSHKFFRRISIYGGAAVALEVLNRFDFSARIAGAKLGFAGGEIVSNNQQADCYRYMLCHGNKISYLIPNERAETKWVMPDEAVDWIFVDRSAGVTDELVKEIKNFLVMSRSTRVAVYTPKEPTDADKKLLELADMIFTDEDLKDTKDGTSVCYISDQEISLNGHKQLWRIERTDLMTHLTVHSIIAATVFGALAKGMSVKDALRYAKINAEGSSLSGTLPLEKIKETADTQKTEETDIRLVAATMMSAGKGILAADESGGNIHQKFEGLMIPDDEQHRRDYRNVLLSTPELERYVNAVILFDETTRQKSDDGRDFVSFLTAHGIVPGVKVDEGLENFPDSEEKYTKGIDGLKKRLPNYYRQGLRFCKWRAAFDIDLGKPSDMAILKNCQLLAEYAKICQDNNLVPIVEPEVQYDGNYTLQQCVDTTGKVLDILFDELAKAGVKLDATILKVNMILAGKKYPIQSTPEEVGKATADVLKSHVPENVAGVVFLSGGQTVEQATNNLQAVTNNGPFPWPVTFSFSRALQMPALETWKGDNEKKSAAQDAFKARLVANTEALKKK
ncbi:fructose-bisphosphate aldolase class I [Candidatus Saccharibacteria bacterium]|nr:fructose-bisphosphate aldolase class I [Candidatus Saccharibacteria bacterium]